MSELTPVVLRGEAHEAALRNAVGLWADATTAPSSLRRREPIHDKQSAARLFFAFAAKHPSDITPLDVTEWRRVLESQALKPATAYARLSRLSSFFERAMRDPELSRSVESNPVTLARPRAPKAYQTESVKSWSNEELQALVVHVGASARGGGLIPKRNYALLRLYLATGLRRQEVISLRGRDLNVTDRITLVSRVKGGNHRAKEVRDPEVKGALLDYHAASGRLHVLKTDAPLWTRHDNQKLSGEALTSHSFASTRARRG